MCTRIYRVRSVTVYFFFFARFCHKVGEIASSFDPDVVKVIIEINASLMNVIVLWYLNRGTSGVWGCD